MHYRIKKLIFTVAFVGLFTSYNQACTIFVLTESGKTLFFNNEDYSNPATRIWFLPGGKDFYGAAYLGYNDNWAQGGVNTKGLAFDWVAGFQEQWQAGAPLIRTKGNPSERMLESCATVEEAIAFYQKYAEPSFSYAKILIADKTGASAIIGAKNGTLIFERSKSSRGFGYGGDILNKMLSPTTKPVLQNGLPILQACAQSGANATKYSNVFDLNTGDIFIYSFPGQKEIIKLNLKHELSKGGHYFDLPQIKVQVKQQPLPLQPTMHRFILDPFKTIQDKNPNITKTIGHMVEDMIAGKSDSTKFSPDFWQQLSPNLKMAHEQLVGLGRFLSIKLLESKPLDKNKNFLYVLEFDKITLLQRYYFDSSNRITNILKEGEEMK